MTPYSAAAGTMLSLCLMAAECLAGPKVDRVRLAVTPAEIEDFLLTDQNGRPFRLGELRSRGTLVFFGFTHCPGVCPATMFQLRELVERQKQHGSVVPTVVMISVDGERDTPAAMKSYLEPMSPAFIGLTGDSRDVHRIAKRFSAVFFKGLPGDASGSYQVEHTSQVYFLDSENRLRATFFEASVDEMAAAVNRLLVDSAGGT